jgi:dipeptidyl aminopeptidase/acylaminoacyl peptidase
MQRIAPGAPDDPSTANCAAPSWSPDASALSFETFQAQERRLYVVSVPPGADDPAAAAVSGVPKELVSAPRTNGGIGQSASFDPDARSRRAVANLDLTWGPGTLLAYVGSGAQGYFGLYGLSTTDLAADPQIWEPGAQGTPYLADPRFHPTSECLVFCMGTRATAANSRAPGPSTAREDEGARLALYDDIPLDDANAPGRAWRTDRLGAAARMVLDPCFSRAGDRLVTTVSDGGNNDLLLWHVVVEGSETLRLANSSYELLNVGGTTHAAGASGAADMPSAEAKARFAPSGQRLAFLSNRDQRQSDWGLWIANGDGSGVRRLVDRVVDDYPVWVDDEHVMFILADEALRNPVAYVNVSTQVVNILKTDTVLHMALDLSRDGRRLAVCAQGRVGDPDLTWTKLYWTTLTRR